MANLGNVSVSSLMKTASGISTRVNDYKDQLAANEWNSSAQTDADWQVYSKYLQSRITNNQNLGTLSGASKGLSLVNTYQSANRSYVSNTIQRSSQAIIEGKQSATDKLSTIDGLYYQAVANGDMNLAQNLVSQHDSLSQQIQYDQQTAATANDALVKANAKAQEGGYTDAVSAITDELKSLSKGFSEAGQAPLTGDLSIASDNIRQVIDQLNKSLPPEQRVNLPTDANLNNGSLIEGAIKTISTLYGMAADVANATPEGSADAMSYSRKSIEYSQGLSSVTALGRSFTLDQAQEYAANPKSYITVNDKNGTYITPAAVNGMTYDASGNLVKSYSTDVDTTIGNQAVTNISLANMNPNGQIESSTNRANIKKELEGAGFTVDKLDPNTGEIEVSFSNSANNKWANDSIKQYGLNNTATYKLIQTPSGYQMFQPNNSPIVSKTGSNLLFSLQRDTTGKLALMSSSFNQYTKGTTNLLLGQQAGYTGSTSTGTIAPVTTANNKGTVTVAPPVQNNTSLKVVNTPQSNTPLQVVKAQPSAAPLTVTQAPTFKGDLSVTSSPLGTDKTTALANYFSNFGQKANGYTENYILPTYAKQFYNGNVNTASADVYKYRTANFGS